MDRKEIISSEAYWLSTFEIKLVTAAEKYRQDNGYKGYEDMAEALGLSDGIMYSVFNGSIGVLQVKDLIDLCLKIGYAPKIEYVKLTDIQ